MEDEVLVHGACMWSDDLKNWQPRFFSLRGSKIGGLEMAYFQDEAMLQLAGIMVTLDLKALSVTPFPQHPHTLIFVSRRGRQFGFSFESKELMVRVGERLPLAIDGLEHTPVSDDKNSTQYPRKRLRNTISLERCSSITLKKVAPPKPSTPKPVRPAAKSCASFSSSPPAHVSLGRKESLQESIMENSTTAATGDDGVAAPLTKKESRGSVRSRCLRSFMGKRTASVSVSPVSVMAPSQLNGSLSSGFGSMSGESMAGSPTSPLATSLQTLGGKLFHIDTVTVELSEANRSLSVWAENKDRFHSEILPYLDAIPVDADTYSTHASFSQVAETFIQRNWALSTCNIGENDGTIRCTFTTRWGERILERIKYLDDSNSKKDLMECLHVLSLSLDLNAMA